MEGLGIPARLPLEEGHEQPGTAEAQGYDDQLDCVKCHCGCAYVLAVSFMCWCFGMSGVEWVERHLGASFEEVFTSLTRKTPDAMPRNDIIWLIISTYSRYHHPRPPILRSLLHPSLLQSLRLLCETKMRARHPRPPRRIRKSRRGALQQTPPLQPPQSQGEQQQQSLVSTSPQAA